MKIPGFFTCFFSISVGLISIWTFLEDFLRISYGVTERKMKTGSLFDNSKM